MEIEEEVEATSTTSSTVFLMHYNSFLIHQKKYSARGMPKINKSHPSAAKHE
jgi:hypothetical protein